MCSRKGNKVSKITLPKPKNLEPESIILPYNGECVKNGGFSFSFACFDHEHELFNLGGDSSDKTVGGKWFIAMLDALKEASKKTIQELKRTPFELHPVKWKTSNAAPPKNSEQCEFWQFRVSKSKGRIIGILIESVFYVVWLDPYHNFTDSEGYGGAKRYANPM